MFKCYPNTVFTIYFDKMEQGDHIAPWAIKVLLDATCDMAT